MNFTPEQIKAALEALTSGDGKAAIEILEQLLVAAASGGSAEPPPPADAGATSSNAEPPPADDPNKPAAEMAAMARAVCELLGKATAGEALEAVRAMKTTADKVESDRGLLEASERRGLVAELVKLGVEFPATAWQDPEKTGADLLPVERLAAEPLADIRKRVSLIKTSRAARSPAGATPPSSDGKTEPGQLTESDLTADELSRANAITDPEKRKRFVELRLSRRARKA